MKWKSCEKSWMVSAALTRQRRSNDIAPVRVCRTSSAKKKSNRHTTHHISFETLERIMSNKSTCYWYKFGMRSSRLSDWKSHDRNSNWKTICESTIIGVDFRDTGTHHRDCLEKFCRVLGNYKCFLCLYITNLGSLWIMFLRVVKEGWHVVVQISLETVNQVPASTHNSSLNTTESTTMLWFKLLNVRTFTLLQVKIGMWTCKDMEIHEFFLIRGYYEDIQNNVILSLYMDTTCEPSHYNIGFVIIMCMYHTLYINIKSMWDPQKGSQCIFALWTYGAVITPPIDSLESHLNQMGEDVLGIQCNAIQVSVLLDEVEQLWGVGHPECQCSCNVLLLL